MASSEQATPIAPAETHTKQADMIGREQLFDFPLAPDTASYLRHEGAPCNWGAATRRIGPFTSAPHNVERSCGADKPPAGHRSKHEPPIPLRDPRHVTRDFYGAVYGTLMWGPLDGSARDGEELPAPGDAQAG